MSMCLVGSALASEVEPNAEMEVDSARGADTITMNSDAIYARPSVERTTGIVGVGGYVEANLESASEAGVGSGISFQARRFTLFISSTPSSRIRFLSEIEFENGTEEINIEFASVDVVFRRSLMLRAGIVMIPIGGFNQNHDGPRWNFVDRPISATHLLPATWSAVGMGLVGKVGTQETAISYEAYATNGLNGNVASNADRRTSLPAGKSDPLAFAESSNGKPMLSSRVAASTSLLGELGISYAGGVYNQPTTNGLPTAPALWQHSMAVDYSVGSLYTLWYIRSEIAFVHVELPNNHEPSYAENQVGGYADVNLACWRGSFIGFEQSALFAAVRMEYVDFHLPSPTDLGASGDELFSFTLGLAYHPSSGTIARLNYRNTWQTDVIGNTPVHSAALQLGITTYF